MQNQLNPLLNYLLSLLFLSIVIVAFKPLLWYDVFGASPSIDHQQIKDPINDWSLINQTNDYTAGYIVDKAEDTSECQSDENQIPSPDISGITYISNGKFLNATLWFPSPFVEPASDKYQENFRISVDYPGSNITLDSYVNYSINSYMNSNITVIESNTNDSTLLGNPAYKLVYASTLPDGTNIKSLEIGTFIGDKVYFITFSAEEDSYDYYLPSIEQMVNSLEIADFLIYRTPASEINIKYPSSWSWMEGDISNFVPTLGTTYNSSVWFYPPSDTYSYVFVQVENLPSNNMSLNDYVNANIRYLKENSQAFDLVNSTITTLADNSRAHKIVYTNDIQGTLYKNSVIVSIKDDKVYYIQYDAEAEKYPEFLATVQQMIDSMAIETKDTLTLNNANKTLETEDLDYLIYQNNTYGIKMSYPPQLE